MNDLILRNHLDFLRKNLKQISKTLEAERSQRDDVENLANFLENRSIREFRQATLPKVSSLDDLIEDCKFIGDECPHCSRLESALQNIQTIRQEIQDFTEHLGDAVKIIRKMQNRTHQIQQRLKWIVQTEVGGKVEQLIARIETIKEEIHLYEGKPIYSEKLNHYWQELQSIDQESRAIFDEYVDFLRGVAMRDEEFDRGICEFADELVHEISSQPIFNWSTPRYKSFAIPSRQEKMSESVARLIRLGFPEWTIWTLSLAVWEFGYFVIDDEVVQDLIQQQAKLQPDSQLSLTENQLRHLIVDAFATYTLGPAYICTVCLLRFNPLEAYKDRDKIPSDAARFLVIHQMLQRMGEDAAQKLQLPVYQDIINILDEQWNLALQQTQVQASSTVPSIEETKNLVDSLWKLFRPKVFTRYDAEEWLQIRDDWVKSLSEDAVQELNISGKERLVFVLNAAWLARIQNPDKSDPIAKAALDLMRCILEERHNARKLSATSAP